MACLCSPTNRSSFEMLMPMIPDPRQTGTDLVLLQSTWYMIRLTRPFRLVACNRLLDFPGDVVADVAHLNDYSFQRFSVQRVQKGIRRCRTMETQVK